MILGIDWKVSSEIVDGWSTPNWYGILFVGGMMIGYYLVRNMFKRELVHEQYLDKLLLYVVPATIIGARLGHVLFYGPWFDGYNSEGVFEEGYFSHPETIFQVWKGGLASHGAALVILLMLYVYSKKVVKRPILWILDRVVVAIALAGCCIRLGNLVNHEIIGVPTDLPWGFKFYNEEMKYLVNGEHVFRHPSQLYEALLYMLSFVILYRMYWKTEARYQQGKIFGAFMILIWSARFIVEFVKEGQSSFDESGVALNTGQLLSIPFVILGLYLFFRKQKPEDKEAYKSLVDSPLNA